MSPVHAWACLNRRTITRMASHSRLLSLGSCISAAVTVLSRRTTLPSSVFSCRALASSIRLIASQVSARIALIVLCSTDFFGLHAHGRRAKARNEAESSRWKANSSSLSWRYCLRSAQRSTASAGRPCRPVSCTPSRRRSAATRPSRVGCSSSHVEAFFSSPPISCWANRSNRLAWTVRSWRMIGSGGGRSLWPQQPKIYPTLSGPACAKTPIPQMFQNVSVCGRKLGYSRKAERQADPLPTSEASSAQACNLLTPAKDLLDPLADLLAQSITRVPCDAAINGGAAPRRVLRHVRGHVHGPKLVDEVLCIKGLVGPQRAPVRAIGPGLDHGQGGDPLGMAVSLGDAGVHDQPVAVLHERVAHKAELGLHPVALAIEPRVRISRADMGLVRALLAAEVDLGIAPLRGIGLIGTGAILGLEALHRSPGLNQRAINREVLIREQPSHAWERQDGGQKLGCDIAFEQPVAVLGEGGRVPDGIIDAEPDEPAEQEIVIQP